MKTIIYLILKVYWITSFIIIDTCDLHDLQLSKIATI